MSGCWSDFFPLYPFMYSWCHIPFCPLTHPLNFFYLMLLRFYKWINAHDNVWAELTRNTLLHSRTHTSACKTTLSSSHSLTSSIAHKCTHVATSLYSCPPPKAVLERECQVIAVYPCMSVAASFPVRQPTISANGVTQRMMDMEYNSLPLFWLENVASLRLNFAALKTRLNKPGLAISLFRIYYLVNKVK